jgi:HEPN domain-containing protein
MDKARNKAIKRWLIKAEHDLIATKVMNASGQPIEDIVCFHAQQCVEKCLKAFLVFKDVHIEKTHDLTRLVGICGEKDKEFYRFEDLADKLSSYATAPRYPDEWREISSDEAMSAIKDAEEVMEFVKTKLFSVQ